ncbi:MAG: hypothetical protein EZS28_008218 [Streblomastix strix]|uniref:Uncharacterized protein n=1 Tax=Streblomastix strix TaxID=222440 RepID=A0A5J4WMY7_9EUKA|nr:MAG: hypothetical protein EZS28_008218 [Streblomastix strix]
MYRRQWTATKTQSSDNANSEQQKPPYQSTYVEQENYSFTGTPHDPQLTKSFDGFTPNSKSSSTREIKTVTYNTRGTNTFNKQTDSDQLLPRQPFMEGDYEFLHLSGYQNQWKDLQRKAYRDANPIQRTSQYQSEKPEQSCRQAALQQIKPESERMSYANYSQTSTRPVGERKIIQETYTAPRTAAVKEPQTVRYGTYRHNKQQQQGQRQDTNTTPAYVRSQGNPNQRSNAPQYKNDCMKRTCMTPNIPISASSTREYNSQPDQSGSNRVTNVKYILRDFDGVSGVMDFGGAGGKGRRFVYKDPSLYVFNK